MEALDVIVKIVRIMKQEFQTSKNPYFGNISASFMWENLAWNMGKKVQTRCNKRAD